MSLPNIPNITPNISIDREDAINLLLASVAMEEIGLSHILNAEGEKLQYFLKKKPQKLCDYLTINDSVNQTLRTIVKSQIMLQLKLEDIMLIDQNTARNCHESCEEDSYSSCCRREECVSECRQCKEEGFHSHCSCRREECVSDYRRHKEGFHRHCSCRREEYVSGCRRCKEEGFHRHCSCRREECVRCHCHCYREEHINRCRGCME